MQAKQHTSAFYNPSFWVQLSLNTVAGAIIFMAGRLSNYSYSQQAESLRGTSASIAGIRKLQALQIDSLVLFDAEHRDVSFPIIDGGVIDINLLPSMTAEVEAFVYDPAVASIVFTMDDDHYRTESRAPYDCFSGPYQFMLGQHTITATPFDENGGKGNAGETLTVTFTVVAEAPLLHLPEMVGDWIPIPDYPLDVGEAQGVLVGDDLIVNGGFLPGFNFGAKETFALDLTDPNASWRQLADCPIDPYWTHAAHAVKGDQVYMCGGYLGSHPGPHIKECLVFDKTDGPMGSWTYIPSLPEGRAAGGMVYISSMNALLFSMGAERPTEVESTADKDTTWMLYLDNMEAGWVEKATGPYEGNHLSAVTATDCDGHSKYFFLGGQEVENEFSGNIALVFEYIPETDEWIERERLPEPRGHATSSTIAYGCGFLVIGGAIDGNPDLRSKTKDITYYDIPTNSWATIGHYTKSTNTPVCAVKDDYLWCTTGYRVEGWKRQITYPISLDFTSSETQAGIDGMAMSMAPTLSPTNDTSELPSSPSSSLKSEQPSQASSFPPTTMSSAERTLAPSAAPSSLSTSAVSSEYPTFHASALPSMEPSSDSTVTFSSESSSCQCHCPA